MTNIQTVASAKSLTFAAQTATHPGNSTLNLPANLPVASGYTFENALGSLGFNTPVGIASVPGETNRLFVIEKPGTIQVVNNLNGTPTKQVFLDVPAVLTAAGGSTFSSVAADGLLGLAFHPNYAQNGLFFVVYCVSVNENGTTKTFERVARFRVSQNDPNVADPTSHTPLISQLDPGRDHNGGDVHFGPDGYLYFSIGDGDCCNDPFDNARFINKGFFAGIFRIDVDKKPGSLLPNPHSQNSTTYPSAVHAGTYTIPPDNPFIGATSHNGFVFSASSVRTEFWLSGFRNPWRFSIDNPTGRLFVGDVGQDAWEEISMSTVGGDCGWSYFEGTHNGPRFATKPAGITYISPIHEYGHGTGTFQGNSVTGGFVYRGTRFSELFEAYIFGDFVTGAVWALRQNNGVWSPTRLTTIPLVVGLGADPRNGDPLIVSFSDNGGKVYRLVRSGTTGTNPPALLSQTGAFSNLATLTPNPGILPYAPNVSFWSDYAIKSRWFSVPDSTATMGFSRDGNWTFPTRTVWIKHFDFETTRGDPTSRRKLETRFLVKTDSGTYGITYRWRADQSDADLVAESGLSEVLNVTVNGTPTTQTWRYPAWNECRTCHTPVAGHALSFNTRQLNRSNTYGGETANQIQKLSDWGYFSTPVSGVNTMPAFASATDSTQSREWRARSYFAVNCVQCHQPGGASQGYWDARPTTPTDSANIIKGALVDNRGDPANKFAVPGDVGHSMVLNRIQGNGVPRMPPLATNELDPDAIQLLSDWITQDLPNRLSFTDWQLLYFGSTTVPNAAPNADPDGDGRKNAQEHLENTHPNDATSHSTSPLLTTAFGQLQLSFVQPANRSTLVEISLDLASWTLWDIPGNSPYYPATSEIRTVDIPLTAERSFFRVQLSSP